MRFGLYETKYQVRKWMRPLLPLFSRVEPSYVTAALLPVGIATAWVFYKSYWGAGAALILVRMFLSTLDGCIAEHFDKCSKTGELLNRLIPECCDILYMLALVAASPSIWGLSALAVCWLISFLGLLPLLAQKKASSVGPLGQTDRLAALLIVSLFKFPIVWFFVWCLFGGFLTIILRIKGAFDARAT